MSFLPGMMNFTLLLQNHRELCWECCHRIPDDHQNGMLHGETRLLRLELTPLGNETFMRLIGRASALPAELGGWGYCRVHASSD